MLEVSARDRSARSILFGMRSMACLSNSFGTRSMVWWPIFFCLLWHLIRNMPIFRVIPLKRRGSILPILVGTQTFFSTTFDFPFVDSFSPESWREIIRSYFRSNLTSLSACLHKKDIYKNITAFLNSSGPTFRSLRAKSSFDPMFFRHISSPPTEAYRYFER